MKALSVFIFSCALLISCLYLGCDGSDERRWRRSDPTYVPFAVKGIVISADNHFVALTVDEHARKNNNNLVGADALTTYMLDLTTGDHRKFGSGSHTFVPAPNGHVFLYYDQFGMSMEPPLLLDGLQHVRTLNIGEHAEGWWNPRTGDALFVMSWPGDREGFNGLTLFEVSTGRQTRIHLREVTELLSFCPVTGNFWTEHWYRSDSTAGTDEYDAHGKFVKSAKQDRAVFSAQCRYVLPFDALSPHGPSDWAIYDARSGDQLQYFPWNEDGKHDLHWFIAWNPVYDHLLLMHSNKTDAKVGSVDVLDVRSGAIVQSWPDTTTDGPIVWSGDGAGTVFVREHHVTLNKLSPDAFAPR